MAKPGNPDFGGVHTGGFFPLNDPGKAVTIGATDTVPSEDPCRSPSAMKAFRRVWQNKVNNPMPITHELVLEPIIYENGWWTAYLMWKVYVVHTLGP